MPRNASLPAQYLPFIPGAPFSVILGTIRAFRCLSIQGRAFKEMADGMSNLAQSLSWGRDEAELVTELQAGSDAAFDWLVTYYHAGVYNLAYGILSDAADAADVTQEVFLHAFKGIRGFRQGSSLKTWLYRISVRQALNHRRWCWRHHRQQVSIDVEEEGRSAALDLPGADASPFEQLETAEMQARVRHALDQVPTVFRSAVILRDLEGLSYEEVAEVLEVSVGTVKSRILRGRRLLREILDPLMRPAAHAAPASSLADFAAPREADAPTQASNSISYQHSPALSAASTGPLYFSAKAHGGRK
jgi:RNA polymerase sigma-70 factor, ECF subfamily